MTSISEEGSVAADGTLSEATVQLLGRVCTQAKEHSYSPYSKFRVGASLISDTGKIWTGVNVENASYGGTICAERTAFVKAVSEGYRRFAAIAVNTDVDALISPCGMCRQFMVEFGKNLKVYLFKTDGTFVMHYLHELLPDSFGPSDLDRPRDSK
ncbi:cytidine deaminase-like protein [Zopfochytrium polystomum]|nr:cytidine deaminase-like protein [Zopfochytrium polystomum]